MVEIRAFRALRYTPKAGKIENLITQPYDKISPKMQKSYYNKSQYNFCRLILPIEENRYEVAKENVERWLREKIFEKEAKPALYVYLQDFEVLGKKYTRRGFICAVKLYPFEEGVVLPHEKTHSGPKVDRLKMLKATMKNLEPGFMLYPDKGGITVSIMNEVAKGKPLIDAMDDYKVRNRIWKLDDQKLVKKIQETLRAEQIVIADGHHRYETAVGFRDELRSSGQKWTEDSTFNFRMTLMVPVEDPGLVILPGHRLLLKRELTDDHLKEASRYFDISEIKKADIDTFLTKNMKKICFVAYDRKKFLGMALNSLNAVSKFFKPESSQDYRQLDVVVLRDALFEGIMGAKDLKIHDDIDYARWISDAIDSVDKGEAKVAFLLNATRPEQVLKVAKNKERMPEKSTDFYPKMISGITMMDISEGELLSK
jgi:uncharacterized protein (DUF1015 family)